MTIGTWFGTDFDVPAGHHGVPLEVTSGDEATVCIVDQVTRGTGIVGRLTGDFGAVAIKVRPVRGPVRVTVDLQLDHLAVWWWVERAKPPRGAVERPRLVLVRAQGRIRGAALLARDHGWLRSGAASARVSFDLAADEFGVDDLLLVDVGDPTLPDWAADRLSASAPVGIRIDRIDVRPVTAGTPLPGPAVDPLRCGFVLLDAEGPVDRRFEVQVGVAPPAPHVPRRPTNRWTRQKPARAVAKLARIARRAAGRAISQVTPAASGRAGAGPRAVDLVTGTVRPVRVLRRTGDRLELAVDGPFDGPVLVGLPGPSGNRREWSTRAPAYRRTPTAQ